VAKKLTALERIDPQQVPLPNGTKVTARIELHLGQRRIAQGAVGQVIGSADDHVDVKLVDGTVARYLRADLVPTKLGQLRYAVRREQAWQSLRDCVVLQTVVGSRAWGLADEKSDIDLKGVFVLPFTWTTSLVEPPSELISADGSETFWEIGKTLRQALRADPNTLETLFLPGATASDQMGAWLLEARAAFASQEIYGSFGRYALSQLKKLRQSLRLAEHRAQLLSWLKAEPSMSLDDAAIRLASRAEVEAPTEHDRTLRAKRYIKQLYGSLYDQGLLSTRDFPALVDFAQGEELDDELPRQLRPKNAYNLIRLIASATRWLATGDPEFEATGSLRSQLLDIKRGQVALADVVALAEEMMPALDRAREHTQLPKRPDVAVADQLLRRIRQEAARRHFAREAGPFGADVAPMPKASEEQQDA